MVHREGWGLWGFAVEGYTAGGIDSGHHRLVPRWRATQLPRGKRYRFGVSFRMAGNGSQDNKDDVARAVKREAVDDSGGDTFGNEC